MNKHSGVRNNIDRKQRIRPKKYRFSMKKMDFCGFVHRYEKPFRFRRILPSGAGEEKTRKNIDSDWKKAVTALY